MTLFGNQYLLGGVVILAFSAGWSVNGWRHDSMLKTAADKARAQEQVKLDTLRSALDAANSERLSLAAELAREKTNIKIKYRTISQEVPVHAPKNTDVCNYDLSPGLVGLLNTAARGGTRNSNITAKTAGQRNEPVPGSLADPANP